MVVVVPVNEPSGGQHQDPSAYEIAARIAAGLAQMIGAVACLALLLSGAPMIAVVALALLTTGLTVISRHYWQRR